MVYFLSISLFIAMSRYVIDSNRYSRFFMYSVSIIGTPVHELGHYLVCKLVGFKVERVVFFKVPTLDHPALGYVNYLAPGGISAEMRKSLVSLGPLFSGSLVIYYLSPYVSPYLFMDNGYMDFIGFFKKTDITHWVCMWVISSVSLHMLPSTQDIKVGAKGMFWVIATLYALTLAGINLYPEVVSQLNTYLAQLGELMRIGLSLSVPITATAAILIFFSITKSVVYKVVNGTKNKGEQR